MGYEVLTAFFLEAGFLGVMLFGLQRVGPRLHFLATLMVAIGTLISAFWILSANSWMQTPTGYAVNVDGQFVPADWLTGDLQSVLSLSLRAHGAGGLPHYGAWWLAQSARFIFCATRIAGARKMFSMAMWMATLVAPIQIFAGDQHGLNTFQHQPVKIMGIEGHYQSHPDGAPLILFGLPDQREGKIKYAIEIPKLGSMILKHSLNAPMPGLDTVPRENWPPVPIYLLVVPHHGRHGMLMFGLGLLSLLCRWRGTLFESRLLHIFALLMGPAGFIAVLAGWITTEAGRQPFTIYNLLRTAQSASPLAAPAVGFSLLAFVIVYLVVYAAGLTYLSPTDGGPSAPR